MSKTEYLLDQYVSIYSAKDVANFWGVDDPRVDSRYRWLKKRLIRKGVTKDELSMVEFFSGTVDGYHPMDTEEELAQQIQEIIRHAA